MSTSQPSNPLRILRSKEVYADPWIRLRVDDVERPDSSLGTYSVIQFKGGIGVVTLDESKLILLVGQFRHAVDKYSWEIPKGAFPGFDFGGDPLVTAKDELSEETGIIGENWTYLGYVNTLLGQTNDEVYLY